MLNDSMVVEEISTLESGQIEDALLDRRVRGIYDIAYLYGQLSILNDSAKVKSVNPEYMTYLTPGDSIDSEFGKPNSAILLQLEWNPVSEEFEYKGVTAKEVSWELSAKLGYCRPDNKSSQKTVHSITKMTSGSGNDFEKVSAYLGTQMFGWFDDVTDESVTDTKDKWIYDGLKQFDSDGLVETVEKELNTKYEGADPVTGLMSVELHIDGEIVYPGETECFNEAMKENKKSRLYNFSTPTEGVCYITGQKGEVFGRAPGSPFEFFSTESQGPFWRLDSKSSSRERPLCADAIFSLIRGKSMLLEFSKAVTQNTKLAYIPYFERLDYMKATELYTAYLNAVDADSGVESAAEWISEPSASGDTKYLYGLYYTEDKNSVYIIHSEAKSVSDIRLNQIESDRIESIKSLKQFDSVVQFDDDSWFYNSEVRFPPYLLSGQVFRETLGEDDLHMSPFEMALKISVGEQLTKSNMYTRFVERLREQYSWSMENNSSVIPSYLIWKQELVLNMLSRSGVFDERAEHLIMTDEILTNMTREERFERFVESHSALDSDESLGAFTLGALVGRLSAIQSYQLELSTLLYESYPAQAVTLANFQQIVQETIEKNHQYMSAYEVPLYSYYTETLTDVCLKEDVSTWDISTQELRYLYALGVSYGYSDTFDTDSNETEDAE